MAVDSWLWGFLEEESAELPDRKDCRYVDGVPVELVILPVVVGVLVVGNRCWRLRKSVERSDIGLDGP